jgi:multimeric flavodoxin WrbA
MPPAEARHLLIVFQSRSGGTEAMADAVIGGATSDEIDAVEVRVRRAAEADADDVRWSDGIILGTPENFGYMSGLLKDFLERIFHVVLSDTPGLPYALFVKAGNDGSGATHSVERIVTGLRWKQALPPVVVTGEVDDDDLARCRELGLTVAAGLEAGVF